MLQSDLEEFLEVARDLGIRGLSQEDTQEQDQVQDKGPEQKSSKQKENKIAPQNSMDISIALFSGSHSTHIVGK